LAFESYEALEAYRARPIEHVAEEAASFEAQQAQYEMEQAAAAQAVTQITPEVQQQLVAQVETVHSNRFNQIQTSTAFEQAMTDWNHLYIISAQAPEVAIDAGNGQQCVLRTGDIVKRYATDQNIEGRVWMVGEVMSLQEGSCPAGRAFLLTIPQLKSIYESGLATMDAGAQQLANQNQPTGGLPPRSEL
jgi:hypothetical protein